MDSPAGKAGRLLVHKAGRLAHKAIAHPRLRKPVGNRGRANDKDRDKSKRKRKANDSSAHRRVRKKWRSG